MSVVSTVATATTDITQYAPLVANAVLQTEAIKSTATSSNKLATALGFVMVAAKTAESVPFPPAQAIGSLIEMIDDMVIGFNDSGLFNHSTSVAATPAAAVPVTTSVTPTPSAPAGTAIVSVGLPAGAAQQASSNQAASNVLQMPSGVITASPVVAAQAQPATPVDTVASLETEVATLKAQIAELQSANGVRATDAPIAHEVAAGTAATSGVIVGGAAAKQPHHSFLDFFHNKGKTEATGAQTAAATAPANKT